LRTLGCIVLSSQGFEALSRELQYRALALKVLYPHPSSYCPALGFERVGATELRHRYPHKLILHYFLVFEVLQKMQRLV
jgi:hypothetical protein